MTGKEYDRMTARELVGRKARLLRDHENRGGMVIGAGAIVTIVKKFGGLDIRTTRYAHCQCETGIRQVNPYDLELLPEE